MSPTEVVQKWIDVFNSGNAEKIAEFYAENAINHQVAEQPVEGKKAIENKFSSPDSPVSKFIVPE